MTSTWYTDAAGGAGSILVLLTTVERHSPATVSGVMDASRFGFEGNDVGMEMFDVYNVPADGCRKGGNL